MAYIKIQYVMRIRELGAKNALFDASFGFLCVAKKVKKVPWVGFEADLCRKLG